MNSPPLRGQNDDDDGCEKNERLGKRHAVHRKIYLAVMGETTALIVFC